MSDGGTELLQDQRASWEQKNGIWYVKKVSRAFNWKNGSQSKTVFAYSNFEINPKVDSSLFKFDALELPEGAMVSDNNPRGGPPAYYVRPAGQNDLKKVDDLLQEMKSRTTTQQPGVSRKKKGSS